MNSFCSLSRVPGRGRASVDPSPRPSQIGFPFRRRDGRQEAIAHQNVSAKSAIVSEISQDTKSVSEKASRFADSALFSLTLFQHLVGKSRWLTRPGQHLDTGERVRMSLSTRMSFISFEYVKNYQHLQRIWVEAAPAAAAAAAAAVCISLY